MAVSRPKGEIWVPKLVAEEELPQPQARRAGGGGQFLEPEGESAVTQSL